MIPFIVNLLPEFPKLPYRYGAGAYEGVCAHATASYAPAANEISYMQGRWKKWISEGKKPEETPAFVQFFCDWTGSYYIADVNYKAYGAGGIGNQRYVHVELCQTRDPEQFKKAWVNYIEAIAWVLKKKALGVNDGQSLVSHHWVTYNLGNTNHTDPIGYLAEWGLTWADVVRDVKLAYEGKFNLEDEDNMLILSEDGWGALTMSLQSAYDNGMLGDYRFVEKTYKRELTRSELDVANNLILVNSALIRKAQQ